MKPGLKINLDDAKALTEFDSSLCHTSIKNFPDQLETAWREANKLDLDALKKNYSSVFFCGMGGSAYPGRIAEFLYKKELKVHFEVVDNYDLPGSARSDSLVFCASYSGNTEETISAATQALFAGLDVIGITTGGKLAALLKEKGMPVFEFTPLLNPSKQPRMGQGYMIASAFALFAKLGLIDLPEAEFTAMLAYLRRNDASLNRDASKQNNQAKNLATVFADKIVNFVAGGFLEGTVHAVRNPINETGKHFASYSIIPEINHHLLEGLGFPENLGKDLIFAFINSGLYPEKIGKRFKLTEDVVRQNKIASTEINLKGSDKLTQTFELIQILSFVSFYLSAVHGINPAPVPWVDFFKDNLSK